MSDTFEIEISEYHGEMLEDLREIDPEVDDQIAERVEGIIHESYQQSR